MDIVVVMLLCSMLEINADLLYCVVLYCIVLYRIVLYCIALHCIALHCIALHCDRSRPVDSVVWTLTRARLFSVHT